MASSLPSVKSPRRFTCLFSIQRNKNQELASDGLKSDCAELIYQRSADHISQIFVTITLWYQQAFLGVQGIQARFAGLKGANPLTHIASLHPMLQPLFVSFCNPAIFSKLWTSPALQFCAVMGFTSATLAGIAVREALFPLLRVEKQVVFSTDSLWFLIHKKIFSSHLRWSLVNSLSSD